ncbi:MAG TPA: hypothetical protein DCM02_12785 [Flavobacterium sp.]|nr:hypothetical protein [Flavobacterium sp.]HAT75607.1 hypothetical protein [Flavobacterium sp.]HAT80344.1 hypothetical protein [Flavobacterium sp.]
MKALKNIFVGFLVSFLGSLPLGYLNIVGVEIVSKWGINPLISYLFGVIVVEALVIYLSIIFSNTLAESKKIMKFIDFFAIFFLLLIAYLFYAYSNQSAEKHNYLEQYVHYSPFLIGMVLCGFNFLQIPFWLGWNLYLLNENYIVLSKKLQFYYLFGTISGTFFGMLSVVLLLDSLSQKILTYSQILIPILIPLFFVALAIFQVIKVFKKYFKRE